MYTNLILDCRLLLTRPWEARIDRIWREANNCADLLAKRGASQREREIFLYDTSHLFVAMSTRTMGFVSSRDVCCE